MDSQEIVLSAIIPSNKKIFDRRRILKVFDSITSAYFDGHLKIIYKICEIYFNKTRGLLDEDVLKIALAQSSCTQEERVVVLGKFRFLRDSEVEEEKFQFVLSSLKSDKNVNFYVEALEDALNSLILSKKDGKNSFDSLEESREKLITTVMSLETKSASFGSTGSELAKFKIEDLANPVVKEDHIRYGLASVDRALKYYSSGNLVIIGAYVSQGKSQMLLNMAYDAVVNQKKNVVFISLEMSKEECFDRWLSRHSLHRKFNLESGILHEHISDKSLLTPRVKKLVDTVAQDIQDNDGKEYGRVLFEPMDVYSTPDDVFRVLNRINLSFRVDVVILDYLTLLRPSRKRNSQREEVSDMVKMLKQGALSFDKGRGVPLIAATQIGRDEFKKATKTGQYTLASFAESSAIEQSADICMWLLRRKEIEETAHELKVGFVKKRTGGLSSIRSCNLYEDFAHSYLGDLADRVE